MSLTPQERTELKLLRFEIRGQLWLARMMIRFGQRNDDRALEIRRRLYELQAKVGPPEPPDHRSVD